MRISTSFTDEEIAEWRRHVGRGRLRHRIAEHPTSFRILLRRPRSTIYQRRHVLARYRVAVCIIFAIRSESGTLHDFIYSTDITPNGTLRRRRSRIPCEDDDGNLMDFLRTSGQDNTRERKSWGSLGIRISNKFHLNE